MGWHYTQLFEILCVYVFVCVNTHFATYVANVFGCQRDYDGVKGPILI
jgi:hypothetical protein